MASGAGGFCLEANGKINPAEERVFCVFVDAYAGGYEGRDGDVVTDIVGVFEFGEELVEAAAIIIVSSGSDACIEDEVGAVRNFFVG